MKKLILLFLIVPLLFSLSFERSWDYDYWLQKNQYIIKGFFLEIWNTKEMHETLESLELENLSDINNEKISEALVSYNMANDSRKQCEIIGERAFSLEMLTDTEKIILELSYKEITEATITQCLAYPTHWKNTMNHALDLLEEYYGGMENSCEYSNTVYYEMDYSGLCTYAPEECEEILQINNNCNGICYFGEFSEIYEIKEDLQLIEDKLEEDKPIIDEYFEIISIFSSGLTSNILFYSQEGNEILQLKEQELEILEKDVLNEKNNANSKYSELEKHNLDKISSGSIIGGYLEEEIVSIPFEFELIGENIEYANILFENADIYHSSKYKNYLKNSFENLEQAKESYTNSYDEMEFIESEVIYLVEVKREEAQSALNLFMDKIGSNIMDSKTELLFSYAEESYYDGEKSNKYGNKYFFYRETVKYINLAEISFGKESGEEELIFYSEISNLKLLIKNAEKDDINMEYEKQMVEYLESHPDPSLLGIVEELYEGVLTKAENKYSFLEEERIKLREFIAISEEEFGYFLSVLEDEEKNVFVGSEIDYENALGELKNLEEVYLEITDEILFEINNVLPSKMNVKSEMDVGSCKIGEYCEVRIELEIYNPYDLSIENPKITVSLPFELMLYKSNLIVGEEHVNEITVDDEELNLYFFEIKPKQTYYLLLSKNTTLIEIEELEFYSEGNPDGTAYLIYEYSIESIYSVVNPITPYFSGELNKIELDGAPVKYENNVIEQELLEGDHELEIETFLDDAFDLEKTEIYVTEIGLRRKVSYNLEISAKEELSKVSLVLDEGFNDEVQDLSVISYSGHQIKNKKSTNSGQYSFDVYGISMNETAIVKVEYLVNDPSSYLEKELGKIGLQNLSEENLEILEEINEAIGMNDSKTAMKKIKELENKIEKEENSEYKLQLKMETIVLDLNKELIDINEIFEGDEFVDDEFIIKLDFRRSELEGVLESYSGVSEQNYTELTKVDRKWMDKEIKNFVKRIYSEYNEIKSQIIELEFYDEISRNISNFELDLTEFEVKNNLEKVPGILNSLKTIEDYLTYKQSGKEEELESKKEEFYSLKESIMNYIEDYEKQYSDADGSNFKELFEYQPGEIEEKIDEIEGDLEDILLEELELEISEIEKMESEIIKLLEYLKDEANRRIIEIEMLYSSIELDDEEKEKVDDAILKLKQMNEDGEYIKVLKGTEMILEGEYEFEEELDSEMILLGITVVLILVMIIYLLKDKFPKIGKKEKKFKKLKKIEE